MRFSWSDRWIFQARVRVWGVTIRGRWFIGVQDNLPPPPKKDAT